MVVPSPHSEEREREDSVYSQFDLSVPFTSWTDSPFILTKGEGKRVLIGLTLDNVLMILPQVHLRNGE
jgi:hypothetical protein